jgi:hypothetical protein
MSFMSYYVQLQKKIQTLIHQAEPLGSSPEAEDNAEVKRKQSAEEVGHFVGFRGISWDFVGFRGISWDI